LRRGEDVVESVDSGSARGAGKRPKDREERLWCRRTLGIDFSSQLSSSQLLSPTPTFLKFRERHLVTDRQINLMAPEESGSPYTHRVDIGMFSMDGLAISSYPLESHRAKYI
jgi:hypothetical protein